MIYFLVNTLESWLKAHGLYGYFRVFTLTEFRAIAALIMAFAIVTIFGPRTIRWLISKKIGDNPEFYNQTLNELTKNKANTPTMGGILIIGAVLVSAGLLGDLQNFYVLMAILCALWMAILGGVDDWLKLTGKRLTQKRREGLYSHEKLLFQIGLGLILGIFIRHYGDSKYIADPDGILRLSHSLTLPFMKSWVHLPDGTYRATPWIMLSTPVFVILTVLVVTGSSNAVNLTDGMDGLASGIMCIVAFALMILCLIAGGGFEDKGETARYLLIPYIPFAHELAIVAGAMVGACLGFLWFNCSPAQVFMGDTGSLALGGLIGYIAIVIRQEFLLLIIGGVFVMEAASVMLQVGYFKATKGKRIFKCAPIHHHFHMSGWAEQQVVVRFWLISAILAAFALATIRLR